MRATTLLTDRPIGSKRDDVRAQTVAPVDAGRHRADETGINVRDYAERTRRWVPVVVIGGLLGVAALAASIAAPGVHRKPVPLPSLPTVSIRSNNPFGGTAPPATPAGALAPLRDAWLLATIVFAVALVLTVFLLWHLIVIRRRPIQRFARDDEGTPKPLSARAMIAALDDGIARLTGEGDARFAVIACWVRLEEAARMAGTAGMLSDAPADLVTRVLGAHQVSKPALTSLANLYRAARYSTNPIDNSMRDRALADLSTVRSEIAASVASPIDDPQTVHSDSAWRRR